MKANVCLEYNDGSKVWFNFESSEQGHGAIITLGIVCRGALMASLAKRVIAYNSEGSVICSYV